jgi:uncharacterized protein YqjF (DUF2071 family)
MNITRSLLTEVQHRPWEIPEDRWSYYQEWNDGLFLHWQIDVEILRPLIPPELTLQTFREKAWVSVVAFTMQKIRPWYLPAVRFISDFHEVNVRTYVTLDGKPGVYFINLEGQKNLSVYLAKRLSGLPYHKSRIERIMEEETHFYRSSNLHKGFSLNAAYSFSPMPYVPTELDNWLVERYCLYLDHRDKLLRFDIHHKLWPLHKVVLKQLKLEYTFGSLKINEEQPDYAQYSPGVKVLAWKPVVVS